VVEPFVARNGSARTVSSLARGADSQPSPRGGTPPSETAALRLDPALQANADLAFPGTTASVFVGGDRSSQTPRRARALDGERDSRYRFAGWVSVGSACRRKPRARSRKDDTPNRAGGWFGVPSRSARNVRARITLLAICTEMNRHRVVLDSPNVPREFTDSKKHRAAPLRTSRGARIDNQEKWGQPRRNSARYPIALLGSGGRLLPGNPVPQQRMESSARAPLSDQTRPHYRVRDWFSCR
jgi:hypothetical protein